MERCYPIWLFGHSAPQGWAAGDQPRHGGLHPGAALRCRPCFLPLGMGIARWKIWRFYLGCTIVYKNMLTLFAGATKQKLYYIMYMRNINIICIYSRHIWTAWETRRRNVSSNSSLRRTCARNPYDISVERSCIWGWLNGGCSTPVPRIVTAGAAGRIRSSRQSSNHIHISQSQASANQPPSESHGQEFLLI